MNGGHLAEEAKKLIRSEVKCLLESEKRLQTELNIYRWVLRFLFVVLLGGSVVGILKFNDYIDARIAKRLQYLDRLSLAISLAETEQWNMSLELLDEVYEDVRNNKISATQELRSFLHLNLLWALASNESQQVDGNWLGKPIWSRLVKDPYFQREFFTGGHWDDDEAVQSNFAFCSLKFEPPDHAIERARRYFELAYEFAENDIGKAEPKFGLAMIALLEDNIDLAYEHLREAGTFDPDEYLIEDWPKYKASFVNHSEFKLWSRIYKQIKKKDFKDTFDRLILNRVTDKKYQYK